MPNLDYKPFTRRRRPHFNPVDRTFFLTFRLAGSIPKSEVRFYKAKMAWLRDQLKRVERFADGIYSSELVSWQDQIERLNRSWFLKTEEILHKADCGPTWMVNPAIADKVAENLHRLDGKDYRLDAFSIMSNHVHAVFKPFLSATDLVISPITLELDLDPDCAGLSRIMHSLKGRSARDCNILLGRKGQFWEHESFDRVIREGMFDKTVRYVLNNPVKVSLVQDWEDWRWNYCREDLRARFRTKYAQKIQKATS